MPICERIVFVAGVLAVHAQAFHPRRQRVVVGEHGAAVAVTAERLCRKEARRRRVGQRAELAAAIGGAERLRRVVEHFDAVRGGDRRNGIVIGRQAEQIDRDHGFRLQAEALRRRDRALKACRIEIEGVGGDVGHHRRRANERHHFGGGAKRECRTDHRIARPDLPRHQHQQQRIGAARTADDVLGAAEGREIGLERAHFRPLDELAMGRARGRPRRRWRCRDGGAGRRRR